MDDVIAFLQADPEFMNGWIAVVPGALERARTTFGSNPEAWSSFLLCKAPRPHSFADDVKSVAEFVSLDFAQLLTFLREISAVGSLAQTQSTSLLAAARDANDTRDASPRASSSANIRNIASDIAVKAQRYWNAPLNIQLGSLFAVAIIEINDLTVSRIRDWLREREIIYSIHETDRSLHGLLLAARGTALVFINADLPEPEKRFASLHEVGHFIFDHLLPRTRVLERDPDLLAVIDGHRAATSQERARAFLQGIDLGIHTHLLDREHDGEVPVNSSHHEDSASAFAAEFLAPIPRAIELLKDANVVSLPYRDALAQSSELLSEYFAIPQPAARLRARDVLEALGVQRSIFDR